MLALRPVRPAIPAETAATRTQRHSFHFHAHGMTSLCNYTAEAVRRKQISFNQLFTIHLNITNIILDNILLQ